MTQELLPSGSTGTAKPVEVVPKAVADYALAVVEQVTKLTPITNVAEYKRVGELLNETTKTLNSINKTRLELARQYDEERDKNVNTPAKVYTTPLETAKNKLGPLLEDWDRHEREEVARVEKEKEQHRLKAEQLRAEATQRQEVAAVKVETATDDEAFKTAAHEFDKGVQVDAEALEMTLASFAVPKPELTKVKGVASGMEVKELVVTDLGALALTYHQANEKKIKAHILDGTLDINTPGIKFTLGKKFRATGR